MSKPQLPPYNRPIYNSSGILTEEMRVVFDDMAQRLPIYGDGSPEGVISAARGSVYYDLSADSGSIHYVKKDGAVSGDTTKGWQLV